MFCRECGTVLNVHGQCVNCEKKQVEKDVDRQERLALELIS
jgi:hypothetical protein